MISSTIIGNLGRDPETRTTQGGNSVTSFSVASSRKGRNGDKETTWVDVSVWGARGEAFARYHSKGDRACVVGELFEETWTDRDNNERKSLRLDANTWTFVKDGDGAQEERPARTRGRSQDTRGAQRGGTRGGNSRPAASPPPANDTPPDDDIPF